MGSVLAMHRKAVQEENVCENNAGLKGLRINQPNFESVKICFVFIVCVCSNDSVF